MTRKFLISALALAAASAAVPAAAQSYHGAPHRGPVAQSSYGYVALNARRANLDLRIDQGVRSGQLSRREAASLRTQFNGLLRLEAQYRRNGLSAWERQDLDRRYDRLSAQVRVERRDRDGRRW